MKLPRRRSSRHDRKPVRPATMDGHGATPVQPAMGAAPPDAILRVQADATARMRELAHDFNNLLAVIMGNASVIQRHVPPDSGAGQAAVEIITAVERGTQLTQRILSGPKPGPPRASIQHQGPPRGDETILVVEDSPEVADMIRRLLASLGYCVVCHSSAEAALRFLETNAEDVHLVTCDMELPGIDGLQFCERLRTLHPHIRCIVISGSGPQDADSTSRFESAIPHLLKPFSLMDLATTVRGALDRQPT